MKIPFTKNEYTLLLEALSISDWVQNAFNPHSNRHLDAHKALQQKLMSYCDEIGAEQLVTVSEEGQYDETPEFEEHIYNDFIAPYNDALFWEELISSLAQRDMIEEMGIERYKSMETIERMSQILERHEPYENEFHQHGVDNLRVNYPDLAKN